MTKSPRRECCSSPHPFELRGVRDRWWPEHLRGYIVGESPGAPGADYFYDPPPGGREDPVEVRRYLLRGLAGAGLISSPTLAAFKAGGFLFDHAIRCQLATEIIKRERQRARDYESERAHQASHLSAIIAKADKVWVMGHIARDAVSFHCPEMPRTKGLLHPPYNTASKFFVSLYLNRFSAHKVREIVDEFKALLPPTGA